MIWGWADDETEVTSRAGRTPGTPKDLPVLPQIPYLPIQNKDSRTFLFLKCQLDPNTGGMAPEWLKT